MGDGTLIKKVLIFLATAVLITTAEANPVLDNISSGTVTVQQSPGVTQVNQSSQNAIVNWKSFNINQNELTHFQQPAGGVALNRIDPTQGASQIFGSLTATGKIILVNQAGIYFGPTARVDVGGIIASTSDISDKNFLAGKYIFDQPSFFSGSIVNQGAIIARNHGLVALVGTSVSNEGLIQANVGQVVLASGNKFTVDLSGDQLINFTIDEGSTRAGNSPVDGKQLNYGVNNSGKIIANGGKILMTAQAAQGVLDNVINMSGVAQAHSVHQHNGEIILLGGSYGTVNVSGKIIASGRHHNQTGGTVKVLGEHVVVNSPSVIDVSGAMGGGSILIGGNFHGAGPEPNASTTYVGSGTFLNADALVNGNGGNVAVWANDSTYFYGNISAQGGALGGSGGHAETSGEYLDVTGAHINLSAPNGMTGTWLLDPYAITISTSASSPAFTNPYNQTTSSTLNVTDLVNGLNSANVTVNASGTQGDIIVATPITWTSTSILSLIATEYIQINSAITALNGGLTLSASNGSQSLTAGTIGSGNGTAGTVPTTLLPAISVNNFTLNSGQWIQNAVSLPTFSVTGNFTIASGSTFNGLYAGQFTRLQSTKSINSVTYNVVPDIFGLQGLATDTLSANYALSNNIDARTTTNWNGGVGFIPIGSTTSTFTGNFNGGELAISNLYINSPTTVGSFVGLFGDVTGTAVIQNIGLINPTVTGGSSATAVGSLIGEISTTSAGGVTNAYAQNSTVYGNNSGVNVGGLVGILVGGTIQQSYASGSVSSIATNAALGGLVGGDGSGNILNSYSTASVNDVSSGTLVGGLVGVFHGNGTYQVNNNYATGALSGPNGNVGGIAGQVHTDTSGAALSVNNDIYDTTTTGQSTLIGNQSTASGGTITTTNSSGLTTANALIQSNYSGTPGWNFSTIWYSISGSTRPILQSDLQTSLSTVINTVEQLELLGQNATTLSGSYTLGTNIDASATSNAAGEWAAGVGFVPIGTSTAFSGTLNGTSNLYTINNLYINASAQENIGLFSQSSGTIQNLGVTNANITSTGLSGSSVGALVGFASGGTITNTYSSGTVHIVSPSNTGDYVGGLVGASSATISNSYSSVSVTYDASNNTNGITSVGGLVGWNRSPISNSYSIGNVTVGTNSGSTPILVGGLVGLNYGSASVANSYSTGSVSGATGNLPGGFVGTNNSTLTGDLWDVVTSGKLNGYGSNTGTFTLYGGCFAGSGTCTTATLSNATNTGSVTPYNLSALTTYTTTAGWSGTAGVSGSITGTPSTTSTAPNYTWFIFNQQTRPILLSEYATTISNAHQLQLVGSTLGASNTLSNNISLTSSMTNTADIWGTNSSTPTGSGFAWIGSGGIGGTENPYTGIFNGQGYAIDALYINANTNTSIGLFGEAGSNGVGTIENLGVTNANITINNGGSSTGALVGALTQGVIANDYATGTVTFNGNNGAYVGGLIGSIGVGSLNTVLNSYSNVNVIVPLQANSSVSNAGVGGFIGTSFAGTISNSYSTGSVTVTEGVNNFTGYNVGGFVGNNASSSSNSILDSYSTGSIPATGSTFATNNTVGGFIGLNSGTIVGNLWDVVTSGNTKGYGSNSGTVTKLYGGCFAGSGTCSSATLTNATNAGAGVTPVNLAALTTYTTTAGWSTTAGAVGSITATPSTTSTVPNYNWFIFNNQTRPILLSQYSTTISTPYQLQLAGTTLGANYILAGNVDLTSSMNNTADIWGTSSSSGAGFVPIGNSSTEFTGNFNGNNYAINNLYINTSSQTSVGLFGFVNAPLINNLGVTNATIIDNAGSSSSGGILIGEIGNSSFSTITTNVFASGSLSGTGVLGGLIGAQLSGASTGKVFNAYTNVSVVDTGSAVEAGGLIGFNQGTATNVYATGYLSGPAGGAGGLVGAGGGITNGYWDQNTTGQTTTSAGYGTPETTSALQTSLTSLGFSTGVWGMVAGNSYPYLLSFNSSTPRVVSGTMPVGGNVTVTLASNGTVVSNVGNSSGTTRTGNNGYFYFLEGNGVIPDGNAVLAYITSGTTLANVVGLAPTSGGSLTGLAAVAANDISVGGSSSSSFSNTLLGTAKGSLSSFNILYSVSSGNLTLGNPINNAANLKTNSLTTYTVDGTITNNSGGTTSTINFGGATAINASSISTSGSQTYGGAVTLGAGPSLTTSNASVIFNSSIANSSGNQALTISSGTGSITLGSVGTIGSLLGAVSLTSTGTTTLGGTLHAASLIQNASSGTTAMNGGTITTTGTQTYNNAVTLGAATTLNAGSSAITFGSTLNGTNTFSSTGSGSVTFNGIVGATPLSSISITGATSIGGGASSVTTNGGQTYTGAVTLSGATTFNGSSLTFNGGINGATSGQNLTINTSGMSSVSSGGIGANIGSLTLGTTGSGTYTGTLTLTGTNSYTGGTNINSGILNVNADSALGASGTTLTFNGGTIQFPTNTTFSSSRPITMTGNGTFDSNGNGWGSGGISFSGAVSGSGGINIANSPS